MRYYNLRSLETIVKTVTTVGTPQKLSPHIVAITIAFVDSDPDTITDSGSGFINAGFQAGDIVKITGSTSNNKTVEVDTVAAGTLTLASGETLIAEAAGDTVTIIKIRRKPLPHEHGQTIEQGIPVPDGITVYIKAQEDNTGLIYLGSTSAKALNTGAGYFRNFTLYANETVQLQIDNLMDIWMDASVATDGVEITFEQ